MANPGIEPKVNARKLFKNNGGAIKQRRAWEDGEFEDSLIRKRG